jgi:hypothetical protein
VPHLEVVHHAAEPGTVYFINRYRRANQSVRTTVEKIIRRDSVTVFACVSGLAR